MDPTIRDTDGRGDSARTRRPDRRALITGGAGFVGVNTANHLIKNGWAVTLLDNLVRPGTERNLKWILTRYPARVSFVKQDVRNADAIVAHVRDQDAVLHLAVEVGGTADVDVDPRGTLNVLEAVRAHNHDAPVVYMSTSKVYAPLEDRAPCKETQPLALRGPYASSKGASDQHMRDYAHRFDMNTVVLRLSSIYGVHQYGNEDDGWVARFTHSILHDRPLTIHGDGKEVRDLLDVRDLSALCAAVIDKIGIARGEVYNVGGGGANQSSVLEVGDRIAELTGRQPRYDFAERREDDAAYYVSDIEKARLDLGWEPKIGVERGLRDLVAWAESLR
ncbi:MAG TPA: NAD-dependent epimerase/dehydratase family protein [Candidatus Dormibacteraeota bacterium]|nr:NAD-dependent epimerase/dehydratase family protein [Candidatus Dormibacteraeota bacterium]